MNAQTDTNKEELKLIEELEQIEQTVKKKYINLKMMGDAPIICMDCDLLYGVYDDEYEEINWICKKGVCFTPSIIPPCQRRY